MGRPVFYRQRIRNQALSVQAKSLLTHLVSEIQARREIFPAEAWLIALDVQSYLGLGSHFHHARQNQAEKLVNLTVVAEEDTHLLEEFGTRVK